MMAVDAGVIPIGGDVWQEQFVLLRAEQLLVRLHAYLLQVSELLLRDHAVDLLLLQAALPDLRIAFLRSLVSPDVDLLNLNVQTAVLEHHLAPLPFPHSALEEIADRVKHWHLEVVVADHLSNETSQLAISSRLYYLSFAGLTHTSNVCLVLAFLSDLFLLLACQEAKCDCSQVEHKVLLELLGSVIRFVLAIVLKLRIFQAHSDSVSDHMFLLCCFCLKESLEVQHLQRVPMEVDPLRHDSRSCMDTDNLLYAFEQVAEELIKALLGHLLNRIGESERVA